ncbi:hypothetical protein ACJ72_02945 [Emergomyces africanus]|uniref:Methyltransferase type 11 domain-containing protein n=1 Tax=Emergomyces africanus TaxID=1955775 RepID=A0A1B7P0Z4_9EURO|nr:hypothetical protein ACJ72_02945 [Emergomyces africanus]
MVKKYNEAAVQLGLAPGKMYAVKGDLSASPLESSTAEDVSSKDLSNDDLALHHMEDPASTIVKLVDRLKSGGVFLAIDLLKSEELLESKAGEGKGGNHHHNHHHPHQGDHGHGHGARDGHMDIATATGHPGPAGHTISHDHPSFSPELMKSMFARAGLTDVDIILSDWKLELPFVTNPNAKVLVVRGTKP